MVGNTLIRGAKSELIYPRVNPKKNTHRANTIEIVDVCAKYNTDIVQSKRSYFRVKM